LEFLPPPALLSLYVERCRCRRETQTSAQSVIVGRPTPYGRHAGRVSDRQFRLFTNTTVVFIEHRTPRNKTYIYDLLLYLFTRFTLLTSETLCGAPPLVASPPCIGGRPRLSPIDILWIMAAHDYCTVSKDAWLLPTFNTINRVDMIDMFLFRRSSTSAAAVRLTNLASC
jgi:hypothetical protein